MRVYVTGSTGMVGRNLCETLSARGYEVMTTKSSAVNLLDYGCTLEYLKSTAPDLVIHAAGKVGGIQANVKDSYGFMVENLTMGLNIVRAARDAGVTRLINLSSSCSYPCALSRPLTEDDIFGGKLEPTNEGYAIAKAAIARLTAFASRQFSKCAYKTLIPCNLYGRYDKFGEANAHLLPSIIRKLHDAKTRGVREVTIWGDGQAKREMLYATDFAEMTEACIRKFDELPDAINIGAGDDYTIDEYYETAAKVIGYEGSFAHDLSRPVGMRRKLMEVSKQRALGIAPRYTLAEGVRETYEYYLQTGDNGK